MPKPGRPVKDPSQRRVLLHITVTPEVYSIVKERGLKKGSKFVCEAILAFVRDKTPEKP